MPFHDHNFLFIFLPALVVPWLLLLYCGAGKTVATAFLLAYSGAYYWIGSPDSVLLLLVMTLFNFVLGRALRTRPVMALYVFGLAVDLGLLGWYKYSNFAVDNLNAAFGLALPAVAVSLPLGISFFSFQKVAYLTEVWRGDQDRWTLGEFFLLVSFFPQFVAGPIVRPHEFIPQWRNLRWTRNRVARDVSVGLTLFFVGLIKKLFIADSMALYVDMVFDPAAKGVAPVLTDAWLGVAAYTLRIYFDFSAYSDMAIGIARLFGLRLPVNFMSPYQADSIIEFWRRWHMTLSRFLRDFLYLPLGGNRHGVLRRYVNLMIVMLLGGLWHGAAWTFVVWGGLHGLYLTVNHLWRERGLSGPGHWGGRALTLVAVMFAWVPFHAPDMASTLRIWGGMLGLNGIVLPPDMPLAATLASLYPDLVSLRPVLSDFVSAQGRISLSMLPLGLTVALFCPNVYQWLGRYRPALYFDRSRTLRRLYWRPGPVGAGALAVLFLVALFWAGKPQTYLYWQF